MYQGGAGTLTFMLGSHLEINVQDRCSCDHTILHIYIYTHTKHAFPKAYFGPDVEKAAICSFLAPMANRFLRQAQELCTPKKDAGVVKGDPECTPTPVSKAKKVCTTFEKWVKKQQGDVSVLREARLT